MEGEISALILEDKLGQDFALNETNYLMNMILHSFFSFRIPSNFIKNILLVEITGNVFTLFPRKILKSIQFLEFNKYFKELF